MTLYTVRHSTTYRYARPVGLGEHRLLYRPRDSYDQRLVSERLHVHPEPKDLFSVHDVFGNCVTTMRFQGRTRELTIRSEIAVEHDSQGIGNVRIEDGARTYPFDYSEEEAADLAAVRRRHYPDPDGAIERWARRFIRTGAPTETGKLLMTLCYAVHESFGYRRRSEPGTQDPWVTLTLGRGTCRDFALFMMEAVRSLGFAARFVSGYIYVPDRDGAEILGGGSTHAWCQVYLPGAGWVEFDPTNGIIGSRDLIRVAVARDPSQAVPLGGTYFGSREDDLGMTVGVHVSSMGDVADAWAEPRPSVGVSG